MVAGYCIYQCRRLAVSARAWAREAGRGCEDESPSADGWHGIRRTLRCAAFQQRCDSAVDPETNAIKTVTALDVRTGRERIFRGKLFADCTGHAHLGAMSGAAFHMEPAGRMGMSNMWFWQNESAPQPWPRTPWALPLDVGDFPRQVKSKSVFDGEPFMKAEWFWESGFNQDPINDGEKIWL